MRRTFLQGSPDCVTNRDLLPAQSRIPEPQYLNPAPLQKCVAFCVVSLLFRSPVLPAVQLDVQPGFQAEEIKKIWTKRMLSPELVNGETPVAEPVPHQLLRPSIALAEGAGNCGPLVRGNSPCHPMPFALVDNSFPLTLALSLGERGQRSEASFHWNAPPANPAPGLAERRRMILPLPKGEGGGEGKRRVIDLGGDSNLMSSHRAASAPPR